MKNILIFGASIVHGVGGVRGWADRLKQVIHGELYGPNGSGEGCEIYELGVPGNTMADVLERFETETRARLLPGASQEQTYIIFSAGANDSKAVDAVDNYPFSADDFAASVHSFIHLAKDYAAHIMGVGLTPVNETLTSPQANQAAGGQTFLTNDRLKQFEATLQRTCETEGVQFVPLFAHVPADWTARYVIHDGIHPNEEGHKQIFSQVEPVVRAMIGPLA